MKRLALLALSALVFCLWCLAEVKTDEKKPEQSPHAEAIQLVMSTQQEIIRKVDTNNWWHDVKTREWKAKRPFHPGTIDSTHMFVVSYHIDGKKVRSWFVDTRKKQVQSEKILEKVKEE